MSSNKNDSFKKQFFVSRIKKSSPHLQTVDPTTDFSIMFLKVTFCNTNMGLEK